MGLITATIRKTQLNNYRLDLEYKMSLVSASKLNLSQTVNDLLSVASDLDKDSPEAKALEARKERLSLVEKKLDEQMNRYETQLKMVEAELQSCNETIDKNIQYSYGGGRR